MKRRAHLDDDQAALVERYLVSMSLRQSAVNVQPDSTSRI
jgi:hypothetical protein